LFGAVGDPSHDNNPDTALRPSQGVLKLRKELGLLQMLDQNISYIIKFISFKARNNDELILLFLENLLEVLT
jgi:hypothetical protein